MYVFLGTETLKYRMLRLEEDFVSGFTPNIKIDIYNTSQELTILMSSTSL